MAEKNPVGEFLTEREKQAAVRAEQDLQMWRQWDQGGRKPGDLQPLMKRYNPLFNRRTRDWKAPQVSRTAFKGELEKQFIKAVQTFDPNRQVALNTHVQNRLQKAKRFNTRYQNVGYIPEGKTKYIGRINSATNELTEQFGREPTSAEIGKHIGLPTRTVTQIRTATRKDVPSSAFESDPFGSATTRERDVIRLMQRRPTDYLTKDEAAVFEHIYGSGGRKQIGSTKDLATTLNTSQSKISRLKTSIGKKIKTSM